MKRECESCIKRKTTYCPNSMECMATDDMPYYQNRIMLLEENQELKSQLKGTTHCFDEEEHNKLKEEITNLSKDVDMWNAKYNDMFDENRELKKQLEERPKEYVFIGNAQNKTRDFINQITKDNKEFKNQQKEFIEYLENMLENENDIFSVVRVKDVLNKYKEIIGGIK